MAAGAGVSRATFYRHAGSPPDLLERHLRSELDTQRRDFVVAAAPGLAPHELHAIQTEVIGTLADHLEVHGQRYELSFARGRSALRHLLSGHLYEGSLEFVLVAQEHIPALTDLTGEARGRRLRAYAQNFAGGHLGLVVAWVLDGGGPREEFIDLVVELLPPWNRVLLGRQREIAE